ncbi:hypothetical protein GCM10022251_71730 [Phytohabitans flavus]|uniref:Uncharacterized protein n=1 Tax=Phytohabitans flavus TaxID=1076124 RepID=A0A6F8XZZ1_9ACTN|nr:hypothetical protein [Phytohabitans flavus]BCB79432.1 hypothetical protein Pflav_058420 [Phytohabitans flavus]
MLTVLYRMRASLGSRLRTEEVAVVASAGTAWPFLALTLACRSGNRRPAASPRTSRRGETFVANLTLDGRVDPVEEVAYMLSRRLRSGSEWGRVSQARPAPMARMA